MKDKNTVFNSISIAILILLVLAIGLIVTDNPLSWKLFPGNTVIWVPLLFLIPVTLSILSLRVKKNLWTKVLLSVSILSFVATGLFALYIIALASAFQH